jgi:hypothetical protein
MCFGGHRKLLFLALLKEPLKDEEKQTLITHTPYVCQYSSEEPMACK